MWGHGFSEAVTRKSFLDPDSGVAVFSEAVTRKFFLDPNSGVAVFSEAVTRKFLFKVRIPEIATFFFFSFHVQIIVRVEICRIARRPMCAYMCM